jgi:type II secretory pathway component PulM
MALFSKVEEFYDQLVPREQKLIVGTALSVIFFIGAIVIFLVSDAFSERQERIDNLKSALKILKKNRQQVQDTKDLMAYYELKANKKPPSLQGHIETIAKKFDISPNYNPKKPKDLGEHKEYHQESVELKFHDVDLKAITQFMNALEKGKHLIMVTEMKITSRRGQHDRLDPTIVVSSFYKKNANELKKENKDRKSKKGKK